MGCRYDSLRNYSKACELFALAIDLKCAEPLVYFAYGKALEMSGKRKEACVQYQRFLERSQREGGETEYILRAKERLRRLSASSPTGEMSKASEESKVEE